MRSNLADIQRVVKPVVYVENQSFIREKFVRFMKEKFMNWRVFCSENQIDIVQEVRDEIGKFMVLIETSNKVTAKDFNARLVFGNDTPLQERAEKWFDSYLDFD